MVREKPGQQDPPAAQPDPAGAGEPSGDMPPPAKEQSSSGEFDSEEGLELASSPQVRLQVPAQAFAGPVSMKLTEENVFGEWLVAVQSLAPDGSQVSANELLLPLELVIDLSPMGVPADELDFEISGEVTSLAARRVNATVLSSSRVMVRVTVPNFVLSIRKKGQKSADTTAPVPGSEPVFSGISSTGFTVSWGAAQDDSTLPGALEYRLVKAYFIEDIDAIGKASDLSGDAVVLDWSSGILSATLSGLQPSLRIAVAVLVRDAAGNTSIYPPRTQSTHPGAPALTAVSPIQGTLTGGLRITLSGSNFSNGMTASVGGNPCTDVQVMSAMRATCAVPEGSAGPAGVSVTNESGTSTLENAFTYVVPALTISTPTETSLVTPADELALNGTCTPGLSPVTIAPADSGILVDADCADGTWSGHLLPRFARVSVTLSATDTAGTTVSDGLTVTRSVVVGQPAPDVTKQNRRAWPAHTWTDGVKYAVSETSRNRVLLWNTRPAHPEVPPDVVIGAPDFDTVLGAGCAADRLNWPEQVLFDGSHLLVADRYNHRVLVWQGWPSSQEDATPDLVLGQDDFNSCSPNGGEGAVSASGMHDPMGVWSNGSRLLVAEHANSRVTHWPTFPTSSGQAATHALGQADLETVTHQITADRLYYPTSVGSDGTHIFAGEWHGQRVVVYDAFPSASGQAAAAVLGAPSLTANTSGSGHQGPVSATEVGLVHGVHAAAGRLAVCDSFNNRVLIWDISGSVVTGDPAAFVLGQADFGTAAAAEGGGSASRLFGCHSVFLTEDELFVHDVRGSLMFELSSLANGMDASSLFGAADFSKGRYRMGPSTPMGSPEGMIQVGNRLIVADYLNNRVLIWNDVSKVHPAIPDVVLGQPDDAANFANNGGLSAASLSGPSGVASDGARLFVADSKNNRILIWNSMPTQNFVPADRVLGQNDFTSADAGCAANRLSWPHDLSVHVSASTTALIVTDYVNNRVLIWDDIDASGSADPSPDFS